MKINPTLDIKIKSQVIPNLIKPPQMGLIRDRLALPNEYCQEYDMKHGSKNTHCHP